MSKKERKNDSEFLRSMNIRPYDESDSPSQSRYLEENSALENFHKNLTDQDAKFLKEINIRDPRKEKSDFLSENNKFNSFSHAVTKEELRENNTQHLREFLFKNKKIIKGNAQYNSQDFERNTFFITESQTDDGKIKENLFFIDENRDLVIVEIPPETPIVELKKQLKDLLRFSDENNEKLKELIPSEFL